ncbi:MAG: DDE-type integrase/transposase/recombinase [Bacteroidota bacterium]
MTNHYITFKRDIPYLSNVFLQERGITERKLKDQARKFRDGASSLCAHYVYRNIQWFAYRALPIKWIDKYKLPKNGEELQSLHALQYEDQKKWATEHVSFILQNAWNDPIRWKPFLPIYRPYYWDQDILIKFSKTHAIFHEILKLRERFPATIIYSHYREMADVVFQTKNVNSFRNKLKIAQDSCIEYALLHGFKRNGRMPYKVSGFIRSRIKVYYNSGKTYVEIVKAVNNELLDRQLDPISLSTLKRVLQDRELRNQCDPVRFGKKYADEHIYPHMIRREPEPGELFQIDATRLNISVLSKDRLKPVFLWLCVVMDVHSRSIIGYSLSLSENTKMILEALRSALINFKYIPKQLLHDNHKAYSSGEFRKFSNKLFEMGVDFRASRVGNPKDKGHVERWFGTFQSEFLRNVYGFLGEGIKTKRPGGRVPKEVEHELRKRKNMKTEGELRLIIDKLIADYNNTPRKSERSPNTILAEVDKSLLRSIDRTHIHKLFYQEKNKVIKQSTVHITENHVNYSYAIYNHKLADKLNGVKVKVRYDPEHMDSIAVYDCKTDQLLTEIPRQSKIRPVAQYDDLAKLSQHYYSIQRRIKSNMNELQRDFYNSELELNALPVISLESENRKVQLMNKLEAVQDHKELTINSGLAKKMNKRLYNKKGTLKPLPK